MKNNKKPEDIKILKAEISRSKLLLDISRKIASIKNLSEILWNIVEFVTKNVDADRGTLFLNDEETNELYSRVAQGDLTREIRILNTVGIAGGIFQSQVGEIIHDVYSDERFNKDVDQETGYKTKNMICSPVRTVNGKIIGVIQVLNKNKGRFTKDNLEFVNSVATQAAVSIQNAQNNEFFEKKRAQEMEFISIVSDVTAEIDLSALLKRVMEEATRMLNADRATLFLNDEKTNELFSRVAMGEGMGEIRLPNTAGIAGSVFSSGKTMNIPYAYADLRFNPAFDKQTGYFTRSILCVPVTNKNGKVIGCTQVLNKKGGKFSDEDESRLKAFTQQVAIALENAKLFDDVSKSRKYNESMLSSMSNGVITIDGDGKIVTCNKSGLKIFKVNEKNLIGLDSSKFFIEKNQWIEEKINLVRDSKEPELIMDAEINVFNQETDKNEIISVNLTILPLINEDSDGRTDEKESFLGILLMIEDISSEKRMKSTMSRYMDPGIADQLLEDGADIMGGLDTTATLLFSDLRSFTNITESLGAQGTVKLLNEYFEIMVECISEQGGMLDKFIGDAIMAAFGLPISHEDDEDRGVKAGINMIKRLWDWNDQREKDGKPPLDMGLGLNTDKIVAGNIGSQKRMDYTMIGDGVNLAARLESACKQYNARILISDFTFKKLKGTYRIRYIDDVVVKGKTEPVGVHEVLDYHSEKTFPNLMDVVNHFNEGRKKYISGNFDQAITSFKECLKINSEDKLSETYIDRCNQLISEKPKNWDGVWVMKSK